jgi:hypothetical protein
VGRRISQCCSLDDIKKIEERILIYLFRCVIVFVVFIRPRWIMVRKRLESMCTGIHDGEGRGRRGTTLLFFQTRPLLSFDQSKIADFIFKPITRLTEFLGF